MNTKTSVKPGKFSVKMQEFSSKTTGLSGEFNKSASPVGMQRLVRALGHSVNGWRKVWRDEAAFRQEVMMGVVFILPIFMLSLNRYESLALIVSWLLVLVVEALNSAVEAAIDRIGLDIHELSGKAKDVGSLAVLLMLIIAGLTWFVVVIPPLWQTIV